MTLYEAPLHRFSREAMNAAFEIVIRGADENYAQQAARAAFGELARLEKELSRFVAYSDVAQINSLRAGESVRVGIAAFECIQLAMRVHAETNGAFDVAIGALLECWQAAQGAPSEEELAAARARTGMRLLRTDAKEHTVGVLADGVKVDLGAVGKGYALDQMAAVLRDWSIEDALLNSGQSTALAIGSWPVAIRDPERQAESLGGVRLRDCALSGSGLLLHGKHIIDPRTGRPVEVAPVSTGAQRLGAWAKARAGAESDAVSTAFMVMSAAEVEEYCRRHPDVGAMLLGRGPGGYESKRFGAWMT